MSETWLPIPGFEGLYEVSDQGRLRSLDRYRAGRAGSQRLIRGRVIKARDDLQGRLVACLWKEGKVRRVRVHHLVLGAFVGPRPEGQECRHLNDDGHDNRLTNLVWGTRSENMEDRVRNGIHHNARKTRCKRDHEFTPENTYLLPQGGRGCKTCRRENMASYRARRKEQSVA